MIDLGKPPKIKSQKSMYLSLCNPQKAIAIIEAGIFKSKYPHRTHTASSPEKPCDIRFISVKLQNSGYIYISALWSNL